MKGDLLNAQQRNQELNDAFNEALEKLKRDDIHSESDPSKIRC